MTKKISEGRRARLLNAAPDDRVRVWSIQDTAAQQAADRRGYWSVDPGWYESLGIDEDGFPRADCLPQYEYMREIMAERVPGYSGDFPIWAWVSRPNMRQWAYLGNNCVMVVADVPRARMVLSDYDLWHTPLNFGFCADTEAEDDAFEARYRGVAHQGRITPEMKATWTKVFDLSPPTDPATLAWRGRCDRIQACIDRIYPNEVVRVTPVTGRKGKRGSRYYYGSGRG